MVPVPEAATVNNSPAHNAGDAVRSVSKVGAAGSLKVTLKVEVPVQLLPFVIDKFAYVPADNPLTVAVPLETVAEAVPLS
jgi:hypothetical protein